MWCNLHGGFLAGLGLIFLYAVGAALSRRPFRPYLGWFLLAGLATLINPYGLKYWSYLAQAVTMPRPEITEWVSIFEGYKQGFVGGSEFFYFLALIAVAVFLAWWARWREITPALVLLFTLYLAVRHNRHRVFFALAFGAYMPLLLTGYFRELSTRPGFMAPDAIAWGGKSPPWRCSSSSAFSPTGLPATIPLNWKSRRNRAWPADPHRITRWAPLITSSSASSREKVVGCISTGENTASGDYILNASWLLTDVTRPFIRRLCIRNILTFSWAGRAGEIFWQHYPPDLILIELRSRVYGLLSGDPEWRQVYADPGCALFRRRAQVPPGPAQARSRP